MNFVRKSFIYHLWLILLSEYDSSAVHRVMSAVGRWCNDQIRESRVLAVLCRESTISRSWESSKLCHGLTWAINLPIRLLQWIYEKLRSQFDTSFFASFAFRLGDETAIAQSWLILLLWIIPYDHWNNGYTLIAFLLLLFLFFARSMHDQKERLDIPTLGFYPVVFFVCVCMAVPLSAYPELSERFLRYHIGGALCVLLTISAVRNVSDLKRLAAGASAAMTVSSLYAVYQRIEGVDIKNAYVDKNVNPDMPGRVDSFFDNPNSYAVLLILLIPLAVALFLEAKHWVTRVLSAGAVGLGVAALAMTYSRAAWVGFACAAVVFVFLWRPKLIPLFAIACVLCIPFLPDSIWNRILSIFNFSDSSTSSRLPLYAAAIRVIQKSPLTGAGLGTAAPQRYIAQHALYAGGHAYVHAHNLFLEVWVETGLIGFAAFLGSVGESIKRAARQVRHCTDSAARTITAAAAASLCGYLVTGLADYPWSYPRVMIVFWFVFAVSAVGVKLCRSEQNS